MKKLKRIFCFLLALILVLVEPNIAEAFSIGNGGNSATSSGGGYLYGSRDSWAFRMGIIETRSGAKLDDTCIYTLGESNFKKVDGDTKTIITEYFNENVPVLNRDASVYCQTHSNQGFGGGEEKWEVANDVGNTAKVPMGIRKSACKVYLNPYANPLFILVEMWGLEVFKGKSPDQIDTMINKYAKHPGVPSDTLCRESIYDVLSNDYKVTEALSEWSGANIAESKYDLFKKSKSLKYTVYDPVNRTTLTKSKQPTTDDKVAVAQTVAYLGALMTVWKAAGGKTTNSTHILRYTKNMFGDSFTKEQKEKFPLIAVEQLQPVLSEKGNFWTSTTDYFIKVLGVTKADFDMYSAGDCKSHKCNGSYFTMIYNLHKYVKKNKSGSSAQGCCKIEKGFFKNCFPRWYSKRLTCKDSSEDSFWVPYSNAEQAMRLACVNKMYGFVIAGSPPKISKEDAVEGAFDVYTTMSEKGNIDAKKKGFVDSDLKMSGHKNSYKKVQLDFNVKNGKSPEQNKQDLLKYVKKSKNGKVYVVLTTKVKLKLSKNKLTKKWSEYSQMYKKGDIPNDDTELKISSGWDNTFYTKYKKDMKGASTLAIRTYSAETEYVFTFEEFKKFCYFDSNKRSKGYFSPVDLSFTADLDKQKVLDTRYSSEILIYVASPTDPGKYEAVENTYGNVVSTCYSAKPSEIPEEDLEPIYFESAIPDPKAEIKCGNVSDSGASEEFEAMTGFPTTRDLYFASGGNEYVVQLEYEYQKSKNGFRTYTQDSNTAVSNLRIDYKTQAGAQDSASPGAKPAALEKTCPVCGAKAKCEWFPFRVAETRWNWHADATAYCNGCPGPKGSTITHSASASADTSDSAEPGPPAVANCEGNEVSVDQSKVVATRWNWEWRNYGHANTYCSSDAESLPLTDNQTYTNSRTTSTKTTLNGKYTNNVSTINNASESCTMQNTDITGVMRHITSYDQQIQDFNYAKITDCKVWKLTESKVKGTYDFTEQDEITATVQSIDDSHLYNVAKKDTASDGRFWHDKKPEDQDEYKYNTFNPSGFCEHCVEYKGGEFLKSQNPQSTFNNTYCISDYLILRTTKGDLSMIYFDYDCKNTTVPICEVTLNSPMKDGTYTIKCDPVKFTDQNERATYKKICTENTMTHYGIELPADGITYGGYNGKPTAPATKYVSTSSFTQNVDIPSLTISKNTYSKYKDTQKPSPVFKLVRNSIDVPDWRVVNNEYFPYDSSVLYLNIINYGNKHPNIMDIDPQSEYNNQVGCLMPTEYSDNHSKINDVIVHNPVSTELARLIRLDPSRDQRTTSSLPESLPKKEDKCPGEASSCAYSHLNCEYTGTEYHTADCYESTENEVLGPPTEIELSTGVTQGQTFNFGYTGYAQSVTLPKGTYKLEVYGAEGGGQRLSGNTNSGKGGNGGYSRGTLNLKDTTRLYVYVGGAGGSSTNGIAYGGWNGGGNGYASSDSEPGNGGGGATDIRLNSSLYSRIIVAGGGGGGGEDSYDSYGHGGGETGTSTYLPGTQTSAGTNGGFGQGASTNYGDGGGGGGGWYGGGTTNSSDVGTDTQGGGGGSGYVYTSSTASYYPSCQLDPKYYLTSTSMSIGASTGSGYARITCLSVSNKSTVVDFDYTGTVQKVKLNPGTYKLEAWGAQGGNDAQAGGPGGYASGTLNVTSPMELSIYVGGNGGNGAGVAGWNGGGASGTAGASGGGGGATDFRTSSSLSSRILVAGGGGGGGYGHAGAPGGGLIGGSAGGSGGTQGSGGYGSGSGSFGQGGSRVGYQMVYTWTHDWGCSYAGETHTTTTTDKCSYCGHSCGQLNEGQNTQVAADGGGGGGGWYGGGADTGDNGGGGGSSYVGGVQSGKTESGVRYGHGHARITSLNSRQTVSFKELTCTEVHHSANTNWNYYVIGWEKENGDLITDITTTSGRLRPRNTTTWYTSSSIKSDLVLVKTGDQYKLAKRSNPYVDLETGQPQTIEKYTTNGTTYRECIWNLTDKNGASINTKSSKCLNHHYSFGEDVCWDPCNNDNNHKNEPPAYANSGNGANSEYFLNLDWGFQLYFPNLGDFWGNGAYGVEETSAVEGKGYYGLVGTDGDEMDTTEWLKNKYVVFGFDVIYDRNCNGIYADDQLYIAGEPVPLGHINQDTKLFVDDQPSTYTYNFYIPMEQDELYSASIQFCAVANNSPSDLWGDNYDTRNYERYYMAAKHDAYKEIFTDIVGRIGGLTMVDTGDFRFANLFKQPISGWLVDNIVHKVNTGKQNYYMADPITVRGEVGSNSTNGLNTHGTQTYKQDLTKLLSFPLVPIKNNIASLQKQPQRIGYLNYMSLETIGNYLGENDDGGDTYKTQVTPFFYHLDLNTNTWTPVDVYMLVDGVYKRIAEYGDTDATTDYEWFYRLNWLEEYDRRSFTSGEMDTTNDVLSKYKYLQYDPSDVMATPVEKWLLMPSGKDYVYGTPNRLFLKNKNRTFIGSTLTQSNYTNPGERIDEDRYKLHEQRWHFHLGLPSSAVFIPRGMQPTEANIAKYNNSHSVAVCAVEILARGTQWTLKYDGVPTSEQVLQILPSGASYNYAGNPNGPGDKRVVVVYSTNRSSKDDLNTQGTH